MNTTSIGILDMNKIKQTLEKLFFEKQNEIFITDSIENKSFTYGEFFKLSCAIKDFLQKNNIKNGEIISYIAINSVYSLALYIGVLLNNSQIALIDPLKGIKEQEEIITKTSPKMQLTLEDIKNIKETNNIYSFEEIDFQQPYTITFTSGSTGEAKGVVHSFENLFLSALDFGKIFELSNKNTFYHNFPMAYMAGMLNTFIKPLIFGCKIVVGERLSVMMAMKFWEEIKKYKINTFWINPTFVSLLLKLDRNNIGIEYCKENNITIFCGTAALDKNLKEKFESKYHTPLYESYGLSETLFLSTNHPKNNQIGAVGEVLPSIKIDFIEEEIAVTTPWTCLQYFGQETFYKEKPFLTGDIGEIKNNSLYITGRKKDIIIKGGVNISPKKLQELISHNFDEFVIMGLKDPILGEKVACFHTNEIDSKEINQTIMQALGKDYTIDTFIKMETIPKNINGKIDKIAIKKEYE